MTAINLSKRTLTYLRLLAKELHVVNPNSYSKVRLINQILSKGKKNITDAENKIRDIKYSYVKNIQFWGRRINRRILILIGILLAIYTVYSLFTKKNNPNYFYSDLQFIGNVKFKTKNHVNKSEVRNIKESPGSPLCGCKNEMPHYGLTFFSYDYDINYLDTLDQPIFPTLEISAPNHVMLQFSNERIVDNKHMVDAIYEPFEISFNYLKISQSDYLYNDQNLQNFIISKFEIPTTKMTPIPRVEGIKLKDLTSNIHIVSLDDVFMSSFDPSYGSIINIDRKISHIQDKVLNYTIESDFSLIDKNESVVASVDVLGRINAYIFKDALITDMNDNILHNTVSKENDSVTILVAKSGFSQKIKPQIETSNKFKKVSLSINHPIADSDYIRMLNVFEQRRNNFYKDWIKDADIQVSLVTPFVQNKPNGIHYYGEFENLISNETKGKIQLGKLTEILEYTKSIELLNIDTMKLFTEPLVFQSNPNSDFENTIMTSGIAKINESEFKLSTSEKILSYIWYFLDSLIGFLGALLGLVTGLKGMTFLKRTSVK